MYDNMDPTLETMNNDPPTATFVNVPSEQNSPGQSNSPKKSKRNSKELLNPNSAGLTDPKLP